MLIQEAPTPFTSYLPMRRTLSERMSPGSASGAAAAGISVLLRDSLSASSSLGPLTAAERDVLHAANARLSPGPTAEPPSRRRSEPASQPPVSSADISREGVRSAGDAWGSTSAVAAAEPRHHIVDSGTVDRKAAQLSYDMDEVMAILEGAAGQGVSRPSSSSDGREGAAAASTGREGAWRGGWQASGIRPLLGGHQRNAGGGPLLYGQPAGQGSTLVGGSGPSSRPLKPYKPSSAAGQRVRSADGGLH